MKLDVSLSECAVAVELALEAAHREGPCRRDTTAAADRQRRRVYGATQDLQAAICVQYGRGRLNCRLIQVINISKIAGDAQADRHEAGTSEAIEKLGYRFRDDPASDG